jgi:hypothetical protein
MDQGLTLEDRLAIAEIIALHAHVFDEHRLDRLDELFTPDAVYDMTRSGVGAFAGIDTIRAAAAQMIEGGHFPLVHHVTNIVITSNDDGTAGARSKGLMIMADGALQAVTHDDVLRRHDGEWRISRRIITPAPAPTAPDADGPRTETRTTT